MYSKDDGAAQQYGLQYGDDRRWTKGTATTSKLMKQYSCWSNKQSVLVVPVVKFMEKIITYLGYFNKMKQSLSESYFFFLKQYGIKKSVLIITR